MVFGLGVTVHHLAFCAGPMRGSAVRRATPPTTSARSRGARDVLGVHAEALPATRSAAIPEGVAVPTPDGSITRPALGRVLTVGGRPVH